MPSKKALPIITLHTPKDQSIEINLDEIKRRWATLMSNITTHDRNEVDELLSRHYADKSAIDEWTSWWHDMSFWYRSAIYSSVLSAAAVAGMLVGLTLPFITIATGIYYLANKLVMHHETHRRKHGIRFAGETEAIAKKFDELIVDFRTIGADVTTALESLRTKTAKMAQHNSEMEKQIGVLTQEQEVLEATIASVHAQTNAMQSAQHSVTQAIDNVVGHIQSLDNGIGRTAATVEGLDAAILRFTETAVQMHETESNLEKISRGLNDFVQQATSSQPQPATTADSEFDDAISLSQRAIARARAKRSQESMGLEMDPVCRSPQ